MIEVRWFICQNGEVRGPFSSDDVVEKSKADTSSVYVWWKGQTEWVPYSIWHAEYKDTDIYSKYEQAWALKKENEDMGSMPFDELVHVLGNHHQELPKFKVKRANENEWTTVYEVEELIETLNLSRRMHPRAPLMGVAKLTDGDITIKARLSTISERGFGIIIEGNIEVGKEYWVEIDSPNLNQKVMLAAQILYSDLEGHVGAVFVGIDAVSRATIIEFVNKFLAAKTVADGLAKSKFKKSA